MAGGRISSALAIATAFTLASSVAYAHVISVKREEDRFIYFLDTPFTPRAWAEPDFNLRLQMFDIPGSSAPNPEVGFALDLPGATFVFFDRLELKIDTRMVINPNDRGGSIPVDDPGAANDGTTDMLGADFDWTSAKVGLKWAFIKDEKSPVRFAVGADATFGILNTPSKKHYDGGPYLTPYDFGVHGYVAAAFSFAKYWGLKLHAGATLAWDFERDAIFPGQELGNLDIWVDYSLALNYLFSFTGTAIFLGVSGSNLLSGVTSNVVEDQVAAFGGVVFAVGTATDVSIALQIPVHSSEFRNFTDFALVASWSMDWPELSFGGEKKEAAIANALPTVSRDARIADCPPGGPSKLTFVNETAYTLVIEYSDTPDASAAPVPGAVPGPASAPAGAAPASAPVAAAPAPAPAAAPAATAAPAAAGAKTPESVPTKTVTVKPGGSLALDYTALPTTVKVKVKAEGAADVPDAEGNARLAFCGSYVVKFDKDSMKTKKALEEDKKKEKK